MRPPSQRVFLSRGRNSDIPGNAPPDLLLVQDAVQRRVDGVRDVFGGQQGAYSISLGAVQGKYGVTFVRYWYDEATGKIFCLSDAPTRDAITAVHREAHGALADDIFEVIEGD